MLVPEGPNEDQIRLRWKQVGLDHTFGPHQISDRTLRFMCLATLLLSPNRPCCIVLDEPELGLQPHAISQLTGLIQKATEAYWV